VIEIREDNLRTEMVPTTISTVLLRNYTLMWIQTVCNALLHDHRRDPIIAKNKRVLAGVERRIV
jgi:hypothetical protein